MLSSESDNLCFSINIVSVGVSSRNATGTSCPVAVRRHAVGKVGTLCVPLSCLAESSILRYAWSGSCQVVRPVGLQELGSTVNLGPGAKRLAERGE